jgi:hypothetical protein
MLPFPVGPLHFVPIVTGAVIKFLATIGAVVSARTLGDITTTVGAHILFFLVLVTSPNVVAIHATLFLTPVGVNIIVKLTPGFHAGELRARNTIPLRVVDFTFQHNVVVLGFIKDLNDPVATDTHLATVMVGDTHHVAWIDLNQDTVPIGTAPASPVLDRPTVQTLGTRMAGVIVHEFTGFLDATTIGLVQNLTRPLVIEVVSDTLVSKEAPVRCDGQTQVAQELERLHDSTKLGVLTHVIQEVNQVVNVLTFTHKAKDTLTESVVMELSVVIPHLTFIQTHTHLTLANVLNLLVNVQETTQSVLVQRASQDSLTNLRIGHMARGHSIVSSVRNKTDGAVASHDGVDFGHFNVSGESGFSVSVIDYTTAAPRVNPNC